MRDHLIKSGWNYHCHKLIALSVFCRERCLTLRCEGVKSMDDKFYLFQKDDRQHRKSRSNELI